MSKFVQIFDEKVVTVFSCPQDPTYWSDVVEVDDEDPRYIAFSTMLQAIGDPVSNSGQPDSVSSSQSNTDRPS
ncbi:hypothetical protein [Pseudomonas sp. 13B_3.2_Bac1]|uniref:hypothetical protein n=1 Tax=Pseudomonas sp. 13B_3.2_Bac1 TaxID=2971623 RepID=UPI0021C74B29|nr:hypothetical protein [Pseudomonas sp. 13B_3.2_Bac1]MCU1773316.1 hypothetical protein [Pseudomonas sp. 13B_3.2_Bac1]